MYVYVCVYSSLIYVLDTKEENFTTHSSTCTIKLNMIKGKALYEIVVLRHLNLFRAKCAQLTTLITCAPTPRLTSQCM